MAESDAQITDGLNSLREENKRLRAAVLNQCGDNLCWVVTPETAKALPEAEFLESCRRYRQQIADERGEFKGGKTIAQLEAALAARDARVKELETREQTWEHAVHCKDKQITEFFERIQSTESLLAELISAAEIVIEEITNHLYDKQDIGRVQYFATGLAAAVQKARGGKA